VTTQENDQLQQELHELALLFREALGEIKVRCPDHARRLEGHSQDIKQLKEQVHLIEKTLANLTAVIERLDKVLSQTNQRLEEIEKKFAYYLGGALALLAVAHLLIIKVF
jgi:chromosome segregation ATPase